MSTIRSGPVARVLRAGLARLEHLGNVARMQTVRGPSWLGARRHADRLRWLTAQEMQARRRSDIVFVFGSGSSLRALSGADWAAIAAHDTVGFNYFVRQAFVRVDFHLVGEMATGDDHDARRWKPAVLEYAQLIDGNPRYDATVLLLQKGWSAHQSNRLLASGQLRPGRPVFGYRRTARGAYRAPTRTLDQPLVHGAGTLACCVNFAFAMGWKRIVLAGVDLYDSRYFWLEDDVTRPDVAEFRGRTHRDPHSITDAIVPYLGRWREELARDGVALDVLNPRSLLAEVLPVFTLPQRPAEAATR